LGVAALTAINGLGLSGRALRRILHLAAQWINEPSHKLPIMTDCTLRVTVPAPVT